MTDPEITLMVGIAGAGKSTFQARFLPYHQRVNLDSIHAMLSPDGFEKRNIAVARNIEDIIIEDSLNRRISVVIDNTNVTRKVRQKYFDFADKHGAPMTAVYFKPDLKTALKQNKTRERKVPDVAIASMCKNFEMPTEEEGFDSIIDARNPLGLVGSRPGIYLDRDGVIIANEKDGKDHFVNDVSDIVYLDNAVLGLLELTRKGYDLFVVSNQGGVALRYMKKETLDEINAKILCDLQQQGVNLKAIYCCTDSPNSACRCRKPNTGLVIKAAQEYDIDPVLSYVVGDMTSDIELGRRIYAKTILVQTGFGGRDGKYDARPTYVAKDLLDAARIIPAVG